MKVFIPVSILSIMLGVVTHYFLLTGNVLFSQIAVSMDIIFPLIVIFLLSRSRKKQTKDNHVMCGKLNELFKKTNKLLNFFYMYFDSNFLLINTVETDESEMTNLISKYKTLSDEFKADNKAGSEEEKTLRSKECATVTGKIDSLISEVEEFTAMLSNIKENIFVKMKDKILDTYDKKDMFHKLVVEYQLYSEIINDFVNSIRVNIDETSNPLSEEIFIIRKNIYEFIGKIRTWKNDLTDDKNNKNFNNVILKYNAQNEEFQSIFEKITKNYGELDSQFNNIIKMIEKVYNNSFQIQDISEKIKLLSINASIEAAHSEKSGKGFKVIADEIKKLSDATKLIVGNTVSLISESKSTIENTINEFNISGRIITDKVDKQKNEFNLFYDILKGYYSDFNQIFSSVSDLTDQIAVHIDKFSPIFQMHDISIQELGNLNKMIVKYVENNKEVINTINLITDSGMKNQILTDILSSLENKITTSNEISVINTLYRRYDINKEINDNRSIDIEIF